MQKKKTIQYNQFKVRTRPAYSNSSPNKWQIYELEKQEIKKLDLGPHEYDQEIRRICKELGI